MKTMKFMTACLAAVAVVLSAGTASQADVVDVSDSTGGWIGFMNVSELPADGGGFVFGSGWGVGDLTADFDDGANTLTLGPNDVADPNEFWYQNTSGTAADPTNPGGPGQEGNKFMEANLFQEFPEGSPELAALVTNGNLTFEGSVLSNSFTMDHSAEIFIKEFGAGFSSPVESVIPVAPGPFSLSRPITGAGGTVQYGFRVSGENVWSTDVGPFGTAVVGTVSAVPEPGSIAFLALGAASMILRRRR